MRPFILNRVGVLAMPALDLGLGSCGEKTATQTRAEGAGGAQAPSGALEVGAGNPATAGAEGIPPAMPRDAGAPVIRPGAAIGTTASGNVGGK